VICHALDGLNEGGIGQATICGNNDTPAISACLASEGRPEMSLEFYQDRMPRGPAGCVRDAVRNMSWDTVVVVDGTIVPQLDIDKLLAAHESGAAVLTIVVMRDQLHGPGRCEWLTPLGIYVFSRVVLDHIPEQGYQDIKESLIPKLHAAGLRVSVFVADAQAPRVTGAETYLGVNGWAIGRMCDPAFSPGDYVRMGEACVHRSARIDSSARLLGPVLVGPHCIVEREVTIVGPTSLGSQSRLEEQSVICRSAIWNNCVVGRAGKVDRCILVQGTSLAGETTLRNTISVQTPTRSKRKQRAADFSQRGPCWPGTLPTGSLPTN